MQRRDWLQAAGVLGLTGWGLGQLAQPTSLRAETPAPKSAGRLRLSLAAYSFNRMLPRNWPTPKPSEAKMSLLDFIDYCGTLDLEGCELTSYYFPEQITPEYLAEVKLRTFRAGLDITGTAIGNDFCHPDGKSRSEQLESTRQWIDYAAAIGAPVIRIFAGTQKKGQTFAEAVELCAAGINESLEYAATKGVCLALENHGGITATPEQLLTIAEHVKPTPFFGINFDSGNFRTADPYADLEKIAPLAINAQIKVEMHGSGGNEPTDLKRVVQILQKAGYRGSIVLEYEAKEDPKVAIPRYLKELRELIS